MNARNHSVHQPADPLWGGQLDSALCDAPQRVWGGGNQYGECSALIAMAADTGVTQWIRTVHATPSWTFNGEVCGEM